MNITHRKGFTLTELMIAMSILMVVVAGVWSVFLSINRSMFEISEAMDLNASTRFTQDRLLFDLHSLNKVTAMAPQSFTGTFTDIATGTTGTMTYTLDRGTLKREVTLNGITTATVVMHDLVTTISSPAYSKFVFINRTGASSATASQPKEVRSIKVSLVPQASTRQKLKLVGGRNTTFCTALVQLRNITN